MSRIAILGGGGWGTALAIVLARSRRAHELQIWVHNRALAETMESGRENARYLPGHALPPTAGVSARLENVLHDAEIVVGAIPSAHARNVYSAALPLTPPDAAIVSATKGLEPSTHLRMTEVIDSLQRAGEKRDLAVLSGPSFAQEAALGEPTAVVLATESDACGVRLQEEFAGPTFRVYTNPDVLGVELGGAMKNVIAIAAGACQGIGLGSNSLAALITRGLAEMTRLAVTLGARAETMSGLAGLGDLVLTCTGSLSRNRFVGIELGKGRALKEILASMCTVAEGVGTTAALTTLARDAKVEMPITEQVNAILHEGKSPRDAIRNIMERRQKPEAGLAPSAE